MQPQLPGMGDAMPPAQMPNIMAGIPGAPLPGQPAMPAADPNELLAAQQRAAAVIRKQQEQIPEEVRKLRYWADLPNVAALLPEDVLLDIAAKVYDGYKVDDASRDEWRETVEKALKASQQEKETRTYPFPNSANVKYPLLATAAMQFNARAYPAIVNGAAVAKVKKLGSDPDGTKASRGYRVADYINHTLLDTMASWEVDTDTLMSQLPIVGSAFRKTYFDEDSDGVESALISALDLVVNMKTKDMRSTPRISHRFELYKHQIEERQRTGVFLDIDIPSISTEQADEDAPVAFVEQHCYYDIDEDGYPEPWIVTIEESSQTLVRIKACYNKFEIKYDASKILRIPRRQYFTHYRFLPDAKGGFYGIGFGKLLESMSDVIDSSLNQMMDAGHLQNAGGGFIASGLNFDEEEIFFEPGRYVSVDAPGQVVRDAIVQNQFPGPSATLFQLLGMMTESAKQLTSVQDILTGASQSVMAQPTTVMALIDQGLKVFTAIYKRIYVALSEEFRIMYVLIREHVQDDMYSQFCGEAVSIQADFADDRQTVIPVADPQTVTEMQRMARAQFLYSLLQGPFADKLNPEQILMRILTAASIDDVQELIAAPKQPGPLDELQMKMAAAQLKKTEAETAHLWSMVKDAGSKSSLADAKAAEIIMRDPIAEIQAQGEARSAKAA